jgi:hypothetical protein
MASTLLRTNNLDLPQERNIIFRLVDFAPISQERKQENDLVQSILSKFNPSVWWKNECILTSKNYQNSNSINPTGNDIKKTLLLASGKPLTISVFAKKLSRSEEEVEQLRQNGQLIGIPTEEYGYLYPAFHFQEDGSILIGLDKLLKSLDCFDVWMQLQFLQTGDLLLDGETPLDVLKQGRLEQVLFAAANYAEMRAT